MSPTFSKLQKIVNLKAYYRRICQICNMQKIGVMNYFM